MNLLTGGLLVLVAVAFAAGQALYLPSRYLIEQDAVVLLLMVVLMRLFFKMTQDGFEVRLRFSMSALCLVACGTVLLAWLGAGLVFQHYPLSADEWWASTEGATYLGGAPYAPMASAWQGYAAALTPSFVVTSEGQTLWGSMYLPVNGFLQALLPDGMVSALLAGWSLVMVWVAARKLMPGQNLMAAVCVLFLAGSAQFVITAMTTYAMTAHLAFNLTWLVLVLQHRLWAHVLAVLVGFAATGLHQFVFFPMFAAPVVLAMWLRRDWTSAAMHTGALAFAALVWGNWLALGMGWMGAGLPTGDTSTWSVGPLDVAKNMLLKISVFDFATVAQNVLRFGTWTHPLLLLLGAFGTLSAWRKGGEFRALVIGVVLTFVVVAIISPSQGHGWGYRYLHGLLGSVALVAALGFGTVMELASAAGRRRFWAAFLTATVLAVVLFVPLRMWQAHVFVAPYVAADRAIREADADFVIITDSSHAYSGDLARNDPALTHRPLRFWLAMLSQSQLDRLCASGTVLRFDAVSAERFGLGKVEPGPMTQRWPEGCGTARVGG